MKKTLGERIYNLINVIVLTLAIVVCVYPLLYILFASMSDYTLLSTHRGLIFSPMGFDLEAYKAVLSDRKILTGYRNTLFILIVGVAINIFMTSVCAYFLSRNNIPLQKAISKLIIFTMYFSGGLIPSYLLIQNLGLFDTIWALILPNCMNVFNMLVMRSYFINLPNALEEAGKIDGAGHMTILFKIFIPISLPVVAVMVLYYGVAYWNSWFSAMIYIRNESLYPLQLILRDIIVQNKVADMIPGGADKVQISQTIKYATIIVSTVPIMLIYPFLQKYFVGGLTIGAVKG